MAKEYVLSAVLEFKDRMSATIKTAKQNVGGLKDSIDAVKTGGLQSELSKAGNAADGLKKKTNSLKSALSGISGTHDVVINAKDNATDKVKSVERMVYNIDTKNHAVTIGVVDQATPKVESATDAVRRFGGKSHNTRLGVKDNVSPAVTRMKEKIHSLTDKVHNVVVNITSKGGVMSKVGNTVSDMANGMLMNTSMQMMGAAGIGFGVYDALKTYSDFESEISGIKALTNMTDEQMEAVRNRAKELGAATRYSSVESAQGMSELLKAGIDVKDVLGEASQAALDLASAGDLALPEAASVMSTAMNAFKLSDPTHAADILAGAANASATDVHEMSYALAAVSAVASGAGMSFDDTNTALAVFAQNSLKGSDAGTSLKTMLANLSPKTDTAVKAFQSLNLLGEDGKSIFYDSAGNLKSLAEIADILNERLGGLTSMEQQDALYKLFGSDAIRGGTILMKEGAEGVRKMREEMTKFTAASVATEKMNNLGGAIYEFQSAADNLKIDIFEGEGGEGIRSFVQEGTKLIRNFSQRIKEDGLSVKSIMGTVGEAVDDLVKKFLKLDGIGSVLAGGTLAAGLYKIYSITKKITSGIESILSAGKTKGGSDSLGGLGKSTVGEMVVNATNVIVNGKGSIPQGTGLSAGGVPAGGAPKGTTPKGKVPALALSRNTKYLGTAATIIGVGLGLYDAYSTYQDNQRRMEGADSALQQAKERGSIGDIRAALEYKDGIEKQNTNALGSSIGMTTGGRGSWRHYRRIFRRRRRSSWSSYRRHTRRHRGEHRRRGARHCDWRAHHGDY